MLGVSDYFLFDPEADCLDPALQAFRLGDDGEYHRLAQDDDGGLVSEALGLAFWVDDRLQLGVADATTGQAIARAEQARASGTDARDRRGPRASGRRARGRAEKRMRHLRRHGHYPTVSTSGRRATALAVHREQNQHWLVRRQGRLLGPVTLSQVEAWIRSRRVSRSAELGLVGCDEWVPLHRALPFVAPVPEGQPSGSKPPPPPRRRPAPSSAPSWPGRPSYDDDEITLIRVTPRRPSA